MRDVMVIGAGLLGAAAARHLAEGGVAVTLLGAVPGNPDGVHASHYDAARITRRLGPDAVWSDLAAASVARYADLEARSGITFHTPCGHLRCDLPAEHLDSLVAAVRAVRRRRPDAGAEAARSDIEAWFPFLRFPQDAVFHWEPGPAGLVDPRRLIAAQVALARRAGAAVIPGVAIRVARRGGTFIVHDSVGRRHEAGRVLVSAGAYTNRFALTPAPLALDVRPETVVLMAVSDAVQRRLATMPGIVWHLDHHPGVRKAYVLPPVRYPDGRVYVKIGSDHDWEVDVGTVGAMDAYMTSGGSARTQALLAPVLTALIPTLAGAPVRPKPCLLTYTPRGYPMIDEVERGWYVAAGGCGQSAKSSDQLGKLSADLIRGEAWVGFARSAFAAEGGRFR